MILILGISQFTELNCTLFGPNGLQKKVSEFKKVCDEAIEKQNKYIDNNELIEKDIKPKFEEIKGIILKETALEQIKKSAPLKNFLRRHRFYDDGSASIIEGLTKALNKQETEIKNLISLSLEKPPPAPPLDEPLPATLAAAKAPAKASVAPAPAPKAPFTVVLSPSSLPAPIEGLTAEDIKKISEIENGSLSVRILHLIEKINNLNSKVKEENKKAAAEHRRSRYEDLLKYHTIEKLTNYTVEFIKILLKDPEIINDASQLDIVKRKFIALEKITDDLFNPFPLVVLRASKDLIFSDFLNIGTPEDKEKELITKTLLNAAVNLTKIKRNLIEKNLKQGLKSLDDEAKKIIENQYFKDVEGLIDRAKKVNERERSNKKFEALANELRGINTLLTDIAIGNVAAAIFNYRTNYFGKNKKSIFAKYDELLKEIETEEEEV